MDVSTNEFRMKTSRYWTTMLLHDATGWLAVFLILLVALTVAGAFIHWSYALYFFAFSLFLFPFIMIVPYMKYSFMRLTPVNVTPHVLTLRKDTIEVTFPESERRHTVSLENLKGYKIMPGGVLIPSGGEGDGWLWLQQSAFETPEEFQQFLTKLYERRGSDPTER